MIKTVEILQIGGVMVDVTRRDITITLTAWNGDIQTVDPTPAYGFFGRETISAPHYRNDYGWEVTVLAHHYEQVRRELLEEEPAPPLERLLLAILA